MTKWGIASDLHLEFRGTNGAIQLLDKINNSEADHILIAGDLHPSKLIRDYFLGQINKPYTFVTGNHDHYNKKGVYSDFKEDLSVGIVAATLWTNFANNPLCEMAAQRNVRDFSEIFVGEGYARIIQPRDMVHMYTAHLEFIRQSACQVVMTHYPPHWEAHHASHFDHDLLSSYFVNNISDEWIETSGKKLWLSGHSHFKWDYMVGDCRMISNPLGYPGEIYPDDEYYEIKIVEA